jgi:DNA polymerase-1
MLSISVENFDKNNPEHKAARDKAKAINFGIIFGSGADGIREFARDAYGVILNTAEAARMIDDFKAAYPSVNRWMQKQHERTQRTGIIETVGGRRHRIAWDAGRQYRRSLALNLPIQGTAAEIAVEAVTRIDARLRRELPDARLVLQVHDEFLIEAAVGAEEAATAVLVEEMTAAFSALLPKAPVNGLAEAHHGANWALAKGD